MFQRGKFYRLFVALVMGWLISSATPAQTLEIITPRIGGTWTNPLPLGFDVTLPPPPPPVPDADGIAVTELGTDLAIRGAGWFVVREPSTGLLLYTRYGNFRIESNGFLITAQGYRVQGFVHPAQSLVGDIQIDDQFRPQTTDPAATMTTFRIERDGGIVVEMSDGTQYRRAQLLLQNFSAPDKLERIEWQLFGSTVAAQPANILAAPGANGLGQIEAAALDLTPIVPQLQSLADDERTPLLRGTITRTSRGSDLAIRGAGAFMVRDPVTGELFATRAGMFLVDSNNYLITYDRKRLQGRLQQAGGGIGDVQVSAPAPATTSPWAIVTTFAISRDGRITVHFSDGTELGWDQIVLYDFEHPEKLCPIGLGQFSGVLAAQPAEVQNVGVLGSTNSSIQGWALEMVNVTPDLLARRRHLSFFSQGALTRTESPSDLAVDGEGFFLLKNPQNGQLHVTRRGDFHVDAAGYLVSVLGFRLQGYVTPHSPEIGDLQVDLQFVPVTTDRDANFVNFVISRDGGINIRMSDGTEFLRCQVLLQNFREPFLLRPVRGGLYGNLAAAVPKALAPPGTYGLGNVESSALELPSEPERLRLPPREGFRFLISGGLAARWQIQASHNAVTWRTLEVFEPAGGEIEFSDRTGRGPQPRYYRVVADYAEPQFNRPDLRFSNVLTNTPEQVHRGPRKSRR